MTEFYETSYSNVHRGVYELGERATAGLEGAREKVRAFVNAPTEREIIFVRNATEGLNLVAYAYGLARLGPGDVVLATQLEHHSNFVPWQYVANRTGAEFRIIPIDDNGDLLLDEVAELDERQGRRRQRRLELARHDRRHRSGSPPGRTSAARSSPATRRRPPRTSGSTSRRSAPTSSPPPGHKMLRAERDRVPLGPHRAAARDGAVPARRPHDPQRRRREDDLGASCRRSSRPAPRRVAEAVGLGAAIDYLEAVGLDAIEAHEHRLAAYALEVLGDIPGITLYGPPPERRAGIVMFNVEGVHPHDMAQILDLDGIAIRAGHHCCQPLMRKLGVPATNRASFYLYTVPEEIDRLGAAVRKARELMS